MNLYDVYSVFDVEPIKGAGCSIWDKNGIEYLDFYGGHAVISIGHSHPHYVKRVKDQLDQLGFYSNAVINSLQRRLAHLLEEVSECSGYDLFLVNSGAEANENALKLASFYNGRKKIIALKNGFHGRTSAAINVTHSGLKYQAPINQMLPVEFIDMNKPEDIISSLEAGDVCAIIIEAIQGIGGLNEIDSHVLKAIEECCQKNDTVLILDEIQCGYQRSGDFFAFEKSTVRPDLITIAKGMGNGFPVGGLLINKNKFPSSKGRLGTTFGGNHLACAASIAVLEVMRDENIAQNVQSAGKYLKTRLDKMKGLVQVKGRGLMLGIQLNYPVDGLRKKLLFDHKIFTGSSSDKNLIRLLPPLTVSNSQIDRLLNCLESEIGH